LYIYKSILFPAAGTTANPLSGLLVRFSEELPLSAADPPANQVSGLLARFFGGIAAFSGGSSKSELQMKKQKA